MKVQIFQSSHGSIFVRNLDMKKTENELVEDGEVQLGIAEIDVTPLSSEEFTERFNKQHAKHSARLQRITQLREELKLLGASPY